MIAHSELNGNCNMTDWVQRYIRACLKLKAHPTFEPAQLDWVSVTFCAQAIVYLTTRKLADASGIPAFHLVNASGKTDMSKILQGSQASPIAYSEWLAKVKSLPAEENPLVSLLPLFEEGFPRVEVQWDCEKTTDLLTGSDIVARPVDMQKLLAYLNGK